MNLFGIVDEGLLPHGVQLSYFYGEGARHKSRFTASMLHHHLSYIVLIVGGAIVSCLQSDSCSSQRENNIVLGNFMLRVGLGNHDKIMNGIL